MKLRRRTTIFDGLSEQDRARLDAMLAQATPIVGLESLVPRKAMPKVTAPKGVRA